jgi:hypothetical protein
MFSFSKALLATVIAWFATVMLMVGYGYATKPNPSWSATPVLDFLRDLALLCYFVGIVVVPTCMLIVTPLLAFVPRTSLLWRPVWACVVAAISGPFVMYLWAAGFRGRFFVPELHDSTHRYLGFLSLFAGVVFAYRYTTQVVRVYSSKSRISSQ